MNRENIEEKYKWDLTKIYKNIDEFNQDFNKVSKQIEEFTKYETIIDMKDKSKIVGFLIHSWEGAEPQFLGDDYYIIKGIKGEAYPCEGNVFRDSYEEKK